MDYDILQGNGQRRQRLYLAALCIKRRKNPESIHAIVGHDLSIEAQAPCPDR